METVELLYVDRNPLGADYEASEYNVLPSSDKHWITGIRYGIPYHAQFLEVNRSPTIFGAVYCQF